HQHASGPQKGVEIVVWAEARRAHHEDPRARRREGPSGLPPNLAGRSVWRRSRRRALLAGLQNGDVVSGEKARLATASEPISVARVRFPTSRTDPTAKTSTGGQRRSPRAQPCRALIQ